MLLDGREGLAGRRPRVIFVGHNRFDLPLEPHQALKWEALTEVLDFRVIGSMGRVSSPDARFRLLDFPGPLPGARFYSQLPRLVRSEVASFGADAVIAMSPYEAAMIRVGWPQGHAPLPVIAEVHGDWRTAAREYGPRVRRLIAPAADRVAEFGLRSAAGVRAVGPRTASMARAATGRDPAAEFPGWFDAEEFFRESPLPLPRLPALVWIGVLERYKDPEMLAAAWPLVIEAVPDARLTVVGRGRERPIVDQLARDFPESVTHVERIDSAGVRRALDDAWALVLSSRSEGLPRVGIEAFSRGRPVVGTAVDGITDLVQNRRNGLLVAKRDALGLARAIGELLSDRELASWLGSSARQDAERFRTTPKHYAQQVLALVETILAEWRYTQATRGGTGRSTRERTR